MFVLLCLCLGPIAAGAQRAVFFARPEAWASVTWSENSTVDPWGQRWLSSGPRSFSAGVNGRDEEGRGDDILVTIVYNESILLPGAQFKPRSTQVLLTGLRCLPSQGWLLGGLLLGGLLVFCRRRFAEDHWLRLACLALPAGQISIWPFRLAQALDREGCLPSTSSVIGVPWAVWIGAFLGSWLILYVWLDRVTQVSARSD